MDSICTKLAKNEKIFSFDIFYNLVCCCYRRVIKTRGCSNFVYRTFKSSEDQWDYLLRTGASLLLLCCFPLQIVFVKLRQGLARDGSQGERPQSLKSCQELTLKLVATTHHHHHHPPTRKSHYTSLMA